MTAQPPRRVLFVGGIADGQWHDISPDHMRYRIPLPIPPIDLTSQVPSTEPFRTHDYQIERFVMFGRTLWVALFIELSGRDREIAAIRALFQRDAALVLTRGQ